MPHTSKRQQPRQETLKPLPSLSLLVMCCHGSEGYSHTVRVDISRKRTLESTGPQQCSRVSSKGLGTKPCMTVGIICLLGTMTQNSIIKLGRSLPSSEVCWRAKFGNDCKVLGTTITHSQFSGKLDDGNKQLSLRVARMCCSSE